ncbi:FkbM family methyltransferase [Nodosilinea sp. LEGE 06152]|uniref:FkbM family methyltransferase n=1 Tax=Nodosilinea sp. LEGE 06152 TaxID=2777966 RepID=UPI0018818FE5|nr:FkbM family methyltransferase [Nodosilinea sp. LEGE 06152]MBE9158409.1 FkbM family methyltransferase [Nodosilinea sp. LEGE 06152]
MSINNYIRQVKSIWNHPSNHENRLGAVLRSASQYYTCLVKGQEIRIPAFGYNLFLDPKADFSRSYIYYTALKDYHGMNFIRRYLKTDDFFIDAGANIGIYSLLASSLVGIKGCVYSFEPIPSTFRRLQKNITQNNITNIKSFQIALGESFEQLKFTLDQDETNHVVPDASQHLAVSVSSMPLSEAVPLDIPWAMAKVDLEGYELFFLRGAYKLLKNSNPPVILLEINNSFSRYGYSEKDIYCLLEDFGYEASTYDADSNRLDFKTDTWNDVLFISKDRKDFVLQRLSTCN